MNIMLKYIYKTYFLMFADQGDNCDQSERLVSMTSRIPTRAQRDQACSSYIVYCITI